MTGESELLRRAATLARDTANAAETDRPTPWHVASDPQVPGPSGTSVKNKSHHVTGYVRPSVAAHVNLWHPQVALAVANWLEQHAADELHEEMPPNERAASGQGCQWCIDEDWPCADRRAALAVARALLNEEPGPPARSTFTEDTDG